MRKFCHATGKSNSTHPYLRPAPPSQSYSLPRQVVKSSQQQKNIETASGGSGKGKTYPRTPRTAKMLLLDYQNVLIQSVLTERFSGYLSSPKLDSLLMPSEGSPLLISIKLSQTSTVLRSIFRPPNPNQRFWFPFKSNVTMSS